MKDKVSIMLDSGAFSAWNTGKNIDLYEYITFCKDNLSALDYIVNLDKIPGKYGQKHLSPEQIEESTRVGWENYEYMIKKGIPKEKLIHVFHQGESFKWLEKIVDLMKYIGLSPANDRTTQEKILWLDDCMKYVLDSEGFPIVKFHGFGVTSLKIMLRYPWYSVDSTSWVLTSRFGSVFVPKKKQGKYVYDENSWKVCVSNKSPSQSEAGKHYSTFAEIEKEEILRYFNLKGYTIEELADDYKKRDELNIIYFLDLEKSIPERRQFKLTSSGGFGI
ncbi:hypothetical protein KKF82_05670 [Patescibacteria group bacterium]|nr:hypothetical protein [Patescibacteria group bacterium]